jgi:hypothetical protein
MKRVEAMVHSPGNGKGKSFGMPSDRIVLPERVITAVKRVEL